MKFTLLFFAASVLANPHGPDEGDDHGMPNPKTVSPPATNPNASAPPVASPKAPAAPATPAAPITKPAVTKIRTPAGCVALHDDLGWPTDDTWKRQFPNIIARSKTLADGVGAPDYKVRAKTYADVQNAVKFAAKHKLRLNVISSGHDFLGRNDAPSGLTIDTSLLRGIQVHESFTPSAKGAALPPAKANVIKTVAGQQPAVTFGVGITTQVLNNALYPSKLVSVGAAHGSVCTAGGFGQTAGHSPISTRYGLAVDQFLEFKVVTPDGRLRIANKVVNSDLFWALRGGGGGTFGVVVEATVKAHPDIPITFTSWQLNSTVENGDGLWEAYAELHRHFPHFVEREGMSGYYYIYPNRLSAMFLHQAEFAGKAKAEAVWGPVLKKLSSYPDIKLASVSYIEYPSFKAYFDGRFGAIDKMANSSGPVMPWDDHSREVLMKRHGPMDKESAPVAVPMANLDSRLLGAEHFLMKDLKDMLKASAPFALGPQQSLIQGHLVSGNKTHRPDDDTSVLPAWRTAYAHVIGYKVPGKASVDSLRKLAPNSGAYANEAFALEPNWKKSFWGNNYERLSKIKTKYDPKGLLWVSPGINADLYEAKEGRICKRTTPYQGDTPPESDNPNRGRVLKGKINK